MVDGSMDTLLRSATLSDLFKLGKHISNAIVRQLSSDAIDLADHLGEVHDVWWQPDGQYYPAELVKIDTELGLVIVSFCESSSDQDRVFGVSPRAIKLRNNKDQRVYKKA